MERQAREWRHAWPCAAGRSQAYYVGDVVEWTRGPCDCGLDALRARVAAGAELISPDEWPRTEPPAPTTAPPDAALPEGRRSVPPDVADLILRLSVVSGRIKDRGYEWDNLCLTPADAGAIDWLLGLTRALDAAEKKVKEKRASADAELRYWIDEEGKRADERNAALRELATVTDRLRSVEALYDALTVGSE